MNSLDLFIIFILPQTALYLTHLVSIFLCLVVLVSLDIGMCSEGRMRLQGLFRCSLPRLPCHKAVRKQWVQAEGSGV